MTQGRRHHSQGGAQTKCPSRCRRVAGDQRRNDYKLRRTLIRLEILRAEEFLPGLRLCSMHNPGKKTKTISATNSGSILDSSAWMFFTRRRLSPARLCATIACASIGKIANSRIELTEKHPFWSSLLCGPCL